MKRALEHVLNYASQTPRMEVNLGLGVADMGLSRTASYLTDVITIVLERLFSKRPVAYQMFGGATSIMAASMAR